MATSSREFGDNSTWNWQQLLDFGRNLLRAAKIRSKYQLLSINSNNTRFRSIRSHGAPALPDRSAMSDDILSVR